MAFSSQLCSTFYTVALSLPISTLSMPELPSSCNFSSWETLDEVRIVMLYFVIGFVVSRMLRSKTLSSSTSVKTGEARRFSLGAALVDASNALHGRCSALSASPAVKAATHFAGSTVKARVSGSPAPLPWELSAEIAGMLQLQDLAALATVNRSNCRRFWSCPEMWRALAGERGLELQALPLKVAGDAVREAFREQHFRVDGRKLGELTQTLFSGGQVLVLEEATHVLRGLMPSDGATKEICRIAEKALQAHDPENRDASCAADSLLFTARRRPEVITVQQVERFEVAYNSAVQLQELMEVTLQDHLEQYEVTGFYTDSPTPSPYNSYNSVRPAEGGISSGSASSSPSLPSTSPSARGNSPVQQPRTEEPNLAPTLEGRAQRWQAPFSSLALPLQHGAQRARGRQRLGAGEHRHLSPVSLALASPASPEAIDLDAVLDDAHDLQRSEQLEALLQALAS